ncbi:hypothetical protein [Arthrobacter sp. AL12]|uniref:hypothetical protein n=1 Tax=Arthrobacter sp. AL12 TaxID=3042241 RepID=UPI00249C1C7E|nr:hypothetical protein [Arthrobacter sp. AL12]MDI3211699.1 hypothetical protein [Arthrobacter sp. AL12]
MTYIPSAPRFHSPSAPLRAALASLPGYDTHVNAVEGLKAPLVAAVRAQHEATATHAGIAAALAETMLDTPATETPGVIAASTSAAAAATDQARTAAAGIQIIEAAEKQLGIELDNIIRRGYDQLLSHLNGTLKDAYTQSRKLGLHGIHDAEQAIEAGKADEWSAMLKHRATIFHIRAAQTMLVERLGSHESLQRVGTFGLLANYAELWPGWYGGTARDRWAREDTAAPWPTRNGDTDPAALHAWILDHDDAEPWVPTAAQLTAAVKTAEAAARAAQAKQDA